MILLWGIAEDSPLAAVREALERQGVALLFVDQRAVLDTELELIVDGAIGGTIRVRNEGCELGAVTAAYVRPYDSRQLPEIEEAGEASPEWCHALGIDAALTAWLDVTEMLVVNRPSAMGSNNSKPYQALQIRSFGLETPDTLITTDPQAAQEFWERYGAVIYKSISGVCSIVSRLTPEHAQRLGDVTWCPTQFQAYIPGNDCRVHVVGGEVFACEVISEADDYRYAARQGAEVEIRPFDLPADCADRCRMLAAALGLTVAGLDLRRAPDGRWYCFEINPSPGFTYYQAATEQPIAQAIAQLLVAGLGA
jgi:hypothetical protein